MPLPVGERHVLGRRGVHADRIDVRLEMRRKAAAEVRPGEAAVLGPEDATLRAHAGTVEATGTGRRGGRKELLGPRRVHRQRTRVTLALERLDLAPALAVVIAPAEAMACR